MVSSTRVTAGVGSVVSGLTDFKDTSPNTATRDVTVFHGLINIVGLVLFLVSLLQRAGGNHDAGFWLFLIGYLVISVGAYIGGHVVFKYGYSVNFNAFSKGRRAKEFTAVMAADALPEATPTKAMLGSTAVVLVRRAGVARHRVQVGRQQLGLLQPPPGGPGERQIRRADAARLRVGREAVQPLAHPVLPPLVVRGQGEPGRQPGDHLKTRQLLAGAGAALLVIGVRRRGVLDHAVLLTDLPAWVDRLSVAAALGAGAAAVVVGVIAVLQPAQVGSYQPFGTSASASGGPHEPFG